LKKGWDLYASQKRIKQKGYLRKYRSGDTIWKASLASSCNSVQQSGESQKEVDTQILCCDGEQSTQDVATTFKPKKRRERIKKTTTKIKKEIKW